MSFRASPAKGRPGSGSVASVSSTSSSESNSSAPRSGPQNDSQSSDRRTSSFSTAPSAFAPPSMPPVSPGPTSTAAAAEPRFGELPISPTSLPPVFEDEVLIDTVALSVVGNEDSFSNSAQLWSPEIAPECPCSNTWYKGDATAIIEKQGWLVKEGKLHKNWKKRWFVLRKDGTLSYYTATNRKLKGIISLDGAVARDDDENYTERDFAIVLCTEGRTFYICALSSTDKHDWQTCISNRIASIAYQKAVRQSLVELDTTVIRFFHHPSQRFLNFDDTNFPEEIFRSICQPIASHSSLRFISARNAHLDASRLTILANSVAENASVLNLDLANNNCGIECSGTIGSLLRKNTTLRVLNVGHNRLRAHSMDVIGPAVASHLLLDTLILDGNELEDDGVEKLMNSLQSAFASGQVHELRHLSLTTNVIGDAGAKSIAAFLSASANHHLEILDLSSNCINCEGAEAICAALEKTRDRISIRTLDLSNNELGSQGVSKCLRLMQTCETIERLELGGNRLGEEALLMLADLDDRFIVPRFELHR